MKNNYKIGIICLICILCVLVAGLVSADGYNVLDSQSYVNPNVMSTLPEVDQNGNVLNPSSGNLGNIMNTLPEVDQDGNVLNPSSANLGNVMNTIPAEEVSVLSETQTALWQGQTSQVYRITLTCPGTVRLTSSYGARFNLYAKKNYASGTCPTASSMRYNYDKIAYGYSGTGVMTLEPGVWCLMVYGYSGSGSYSLRVSSTCSRPTPTPTPTVTPTPYPTPCGVYKTDTRQGFLNQGQAAVYGYYIPTDGRTKLDWTMTSTGSCNSGNTPVIIASTDTSIQSTDCPGSGLFDLYIFKDCNPKTSRCNTRYYSRGPNSYVSIASPTSGSTYYAMVMARSGSGTFIVSCKTYLNNN